MLIAQPNRGADDKLSNDSVIELKKADVSDDLIITAIKSAPANFDLSVAEIKRLKAAGISDPVLSAMFAIQNASSKPSSFTPAAQPSAEEKKKDENGELVREQAQKFSLAAAGYGGKLSRRAYWRVKAEPDKVAAAIRAAIEKSDPKWQVGQESGSGDDIRLIKVFTKGFLTTPRQGIFQLGKVEDETHVYVAIVFLDDPMRSPQRVAELRGFLPQALESIRTGMEANLATKMDGRVEKPAAESAATKRDLRYGDVVVVKFTSALLHYKGKSLPVVPFEVEVAKGQPAFAIFKTADNLHANPIQIDLDNSAASVHLDGFDPCANANWQTQQSGWVNGSNYKPKKRSIPEHYVSDVEMFVKFKPMP
jgi:hypothetical protein